MSGYLIVGTLAASLAFAGIMAVWLRAFSLEYYWMQTASRLEAQHSRMTRDYFEFIERQSKNLDKMSEDQKAAFKNGVSVYADFTVLTKAIGKRYSESGPRFSLFAPVIIVLVLAMALSFAVLVSNTLLAIAFALAATAAGAVAIKRSVRMLYKLQVEPIELDAGVLAAGPERDCLCSQVKQSTVRADKLIYSVYLSYPQVEGALREMVQFFGETVQRPKD